MFKRCNYPKGAPLAEATAANSGIENQAYWITAAGARLPLSEQGGNMACTNTMQAEPCGADGGAANAAAKERPSVEEDPLFWTAVEGCMALFSQHAAPAAAPSWPPTATSSVPIASSSADAPFVDDAEDREPGFDGADSTASRTYTPPMLARAPSPALLGGIGAVVLNGKRLRSARCGQCRGCNSGDCGSCKNCLDKPKFGGPGCRKQACMARTCSQPRVVDDEDEADEFGGGGGEARRATERKRDAMALISEATYTSDRSGAASPRDGGMEAETDMLSAPALMHIAIPPRTVPAAGVVMSVCAHAHASMSAQPLAPGPYLLQPAAPVSAAPVTAAPVSAAPVTAAPVSAAPVAAAPVRAAPVSAAPVAAAPVAAAPVAAAPVAAAPVAAAPVAAAPVAVRHTVVAATKAATATNSDAAATAKQIGSGSGETTHLTTAAATLFGAINRTFSSEV